MMERGVEARFTTIEERLKKVEDEEGKAVKERERKRLYYLNHKKRDQTDAIHCPHCPKHFFSPQKYITHLFRVHRWTNHNIQAATSTQSMVRRVERLW